MPEEKKRENRRRQILARVISDKMDKTIVVELERTFRHPFYGKVVRRRSKFFSHDQNNQAKVGDLVRLAETRRLSARKRWRLVEVVERAKT
ncbi:MAG: 30S ribosomal protein S17 [candidate division Zixibacteria bacterium RBG_16_50_21]|nr:MAG: 30S ribosomal protein S17 [candidate division Zixibacteria bacterium RBG_16_50_21]